MCVCGKVRVCTTWTVRRTVYWYAYYWVVYVRVYVGKFVCVRRELFTYSVLVCVLQSRIRVYVGTWVYLNNGTSYTCTWYNSIRLSLKELLFDKNYRFYKLFKLNTIFYYEILIAQILIIASVTFFTNNIRLFLNQWKLHEYIYNV